VRKESWISVIYRVFLGLKKPTEEEIYQEKDAQMRGEYYDPIERFPEKIDQLLDALNRVSFLKNKELNFSLFYFRFIWIKDMNFI